jgi:transcriptional regulator with XRE-family HTH domain
MNNNSSAVNLGELLRLRRITLHLTLQQLAEKSRTSPSHLGRIEKGTRFPSARVLHRLSPHLGFEENHLFHLAGYLTQEPGMVAEGNVDFTAGQLDPYVARTLAQEPPEVQHAVLGILSLLKNLGRGLAAKNPPSTNGSAAERD